MLTLLVASAALASANPTVDVSWKGAHGTLTVHAPAGEHVAPEAWVDAALTYGDTEMTWSAPGANLDGGVPLSGVRGQELEGALRLSLCEDSGTLCRLVDIEVSGTVADARKGRVSLLVREPGSHAESGDSPFRADAAARVEKAFASARARQVPVLLDFTAVWCPPCNLLSAEVLHDEGYDDLLSRFEVVAVDVDDPSSWAVKDRYGVGGYPTLLVADPEGVEVDRLVGYDSPTHTVSFLGRTLHGPPEGEATDPKLAAERAWWLVQQGREDDARPLMEVAAAEPDRVAYRLARVSLEPSLDDAKWLADNAPGTAIDWVYGARALAEDDEGKVVLTRALQADLRTEDPVDASDLMYIMGLIVGEPHARTWNAAAVASLRAGFTGDALRDRAYWTWYAELLQLSGDPDAALAFLDEAAEQFPDEPTWALSASGILLDAERPEEALARAEAAMPLAWGDNRLRLATRKVEALHALGRADEARAFGDAVLAEVPTPDDGLDIRTPRYREQLAQAMAGDAEQ